MTATSTSGLNRRASCGGAWIGVRLWAATEQRVGGTHRVESGLELAHQVAGGQPACVLPVGLGEARVTGASAPTPSSNSSSPMLTPPFCHPPRRSEHYPSDGAAGTVRAPTRSNQQYRLDNPSPLTVRLHAFGSDAHGHQTASHRTPPGAFAKIG
jgi:hypothetical protein